MTEEFKLPEDIVQVEKQAPPRDLVIIGQPKIGKGTILGEFTKKYNSANDYEKMKIIILWFRQEKRYF